jgi:hypothetical protein
MQIIVKCCFMHRSTRPADASADISTDASSDASSDARSDAGANGSIYRFVLRNMLFSECNLLCAAIGK